MVEITAIAAALQSLKAASEMAQALIGMRDAQAFLGQSIEVGRKIVEAQGHAAAAYATQTELTNRIGQLERELMEMEDWRAKRERYELVELRGGAICFRTKESVRGADPVHHACPSCMEDRKISILQPRQWHLQGEMLECPVCQLRISKDARQ